jgi:hypothetical protein
LLKSTFTKDNISIIKHFMRHISKCPDWIELCRCKLW